MPGLNSPDSMPYTSKRILRKKVFPYVSAKEIVKVDLEITVSYDTIEKDG